jgi:FkbM family methyltransferase
MLRRKGVRVALIVLAVAGLVFAFLRSPQFARLYFRFEQTWIDRYPGILKLTPILCRTGILHPVRLTVEPGVSFLLDPRDLVPLSILRNGAWQPEVWDSVTPQLFEGSVFLDVGAHIGYFSMKASVKVGKTGKVLAFEPNPETLKLLRDNVSFNHADNVIVEPVACTDREQMLTLYAANIINTGASSLARLNVDGIGGEYGRPYPVRGRPIDDVVRELKLTRVDAIKVDVEGAEAYVLRGAMNTLKRFHPKLVIEVVPAQLANMNTTVDDLTSVIRAAGYDRVRRLLPGGDDWEWSVNQPQ